MPDFDGDIKLGVSLEPKDIKSAAKSLMDALGKIFKYGSGKELDTKFKSLQASISKTADKATLLQQKISDLENAKIPTEEYKQLSGWLDKQVTALSSAEEKMDRMIDSGKNSGDAWSRVREEVDQLRNSVEYGKGELQDLVDTGKAFTLGSETEEYQKLIGQLNDVNNQQTINIAKAEEMMQAAEEAARVKQEQLDAEKLAEEELIQEQQRAAEVQRILDEEQAAAEEAQTNRYSGLLGTLARVRDAFLNVGMAVRESIPGAVENVRASIANFAQNSILKLRESISQLSSGKILGKLANVASSIKNIGHSAKSAHSPVSSLFKKFLMYGLGIRSVYMLVRKLRSAIMEGFKAMAQMNGGVNSTNTALSALQSSLSYVRNSWAAAFSPILEFVTPALVRLMDLLAKAASYLSMFFSFIGGKSTYRVAIKGQTDFAKSLGATGGAAEKAYDKLAPFDDLQVLGEDKGSGGGGAGGDLGDMFEDIPIDENEIPDWLKELWELIKSLFDRIMEAVNRLRTALRNLWEAIKKSLQELWDEGVIQAWLESVANLIISIIDILTAAVESFTKAWEQDNNGTNYLRSLFQMLTSINNMIIEINRSIERAFRSDVGVDIFVNILQIFTHINNTIRNLADNFRQAWVEGERGDQIIMSIFTSVDILLTHVNNVTAAMEKWSETIDFGPALDGILLILQDIQPIVDDIGSALEWLWNEILAPLSTWTIEEFVPEALNIIAAALELMEPIISTVGEWLAYIWDNFLAPVANFVGDAIIAFMNDFAEFLRIVAENETVVEILAGIALTLGAVFGAMSLFNGLVAILSSPIFWIGVLIVAIVELVTHWDEVKAKTIEVWNKITEKVREAVESVKNKFEEFKTNIETKLAGVTLAVGLFIGNVENFFVTKFEEIKNFFIGVWQEIVDWVTQKIAELQLVLDSIVEFFTVTIPAKIEEFKTFITQRVEEIKTNVTTAFTNLKTTVETTVTTFISNIQTKFNTLKTQIISKVEAIRTQVETKFQALHDKAIEIAGLLSTALATKWEEIRTSLSDTLDNIKEKWDNIWEGMKKTLQTIVNAIIGIINSMISAVAEGINSIISAINSFAAIDIPDWVPKVGGQSYSWLNIPTVNAPQIPLLAQGAVIPANHEFLAMLGDQRQGTNIEAPLDTIVAAFQEVVGNMQVQNTGYSEMTLDGETFARLAVPYIVSELHREGYNVTVLEG